MSSSFDVKFAGPKTDIVVGSGTFHIRRKHVWPAPEAHVYKGEQ